MQIKIKNQADLLKHLQFHDQAGGLGRFRLNSDNTIDVVCINSEVGKLFTIALNISHCCHCGGKFIVRDNK